MTALRIRGRTLELDARAPVLMGIVNASPDSFSDAGEFPDPVERALALEAAWIDVGGESASGHVPAVAAEEEIERVLPVVRALAQRDVVISVDTYKPAVAEAALAAGAHVINDVSGLADPELGEVCAAAGAGLVVMHTRAAPKATLLDPAHYPDVVEDVRAFLAERIEHAVSLGLGEEQLILDPGPDFTKTPAQTVAVLRRLDVLHALGRPLLLAISRKDFLGAITGRAARDRDAATLAALGWVADAGAHVVRVHDVDGARDFLAVRAALRGDRELAPDAGLEPGRYPDGTVVEGTWRPE